MSEPTIIKPEDINPNYQWHRRVPSHGTMNVDYEERINFQRLHKYRLGRAKQALNNSQAGSLLCFDNNNIRYLTSTVIGEWSRDKIARYSLLANSEYRAILSLDHSPITVLVRYRMLLLSKQRREPAWELFKACFALPSLYLWSLWKLILSS